MNAESPRVVQDYLETKRVAFPRFYFVAPADLLDILAKGSNPQAIIRCSTCSLCTYLSCISRPCGRLQLG